MNLKKQLSSLPFFEKHPNLTPFVGERYEEQRILLIGDYHFTSDASKDEETYVKDWYEGTHTNGDERSEEARISAYVKGEHHVALYQDPLLCYYRALHRERKNPSAKEREEAFSQMAFYHYYLRPQMKKSQISAQDKEVAAEVFMQIIDILEPQGVVVLSKRAGADIEAVLQANGRNEINILYLEHPNSKYWHRAKRYSKLSSKEQLTKFFYFLNVNDFVNPHQ